MVTADAAVFRFLNNNVELLLIKRGNEPFKGKWALPGGYVDIDEELEDAAARELAEEAGLEGVQLEQMRTFGGCGRDPRGRQITVVFMGIAEHGRHRIKAGDDAKDARWFDIERLPEDLAFDHEQVVRVAIGKLKKKGVYQRHKQRVKQVRRRSVTS
jgi:8-oxo-dGTP diphosphatase